MGFGTFNMGSVNVNADTQHLVPDEANAEIITVALTTADTVEEVISIDPLIKARKIFVRNTHSTATIHFGLPTMTDASEAIVSIPPGVLIWDTIGQGAYSFVSDTAGASLTVNIIPMVEV
ncbi:hypothetical protein [Vibrio sp.]|uniref:hypothetical protein n=1 Tax=Vibrio sp. TaxID=678 RepID=UPI003D140CD2